MERLGLLDRLSTPLLRSDVLEGLGEGPLMPEGILGFVLGLAILKVGRFHDDASAVCPSLLAVGPRVLHSHHHRVGHLVWSGRTAVPAHISDDHRAVAHAQLRAVVLTDTDPLNETEGSLEPGDRFPHVGVDVACADDA